jgi:hypothetical protein
MWRRQAGEERGFVIVFLGFSLTTILGVAGIAVDLGHWYLVAERNQRAADAAALAGAVYLPASPGKANQQAEQVVSANNVDYDEIDHHPMADEPAKMFVSVTETVPSVFTRLVGFDALTIKRKAVALYRPPLQMGSPSNVLGSEPPLDQWENASLAPLQDNYWLTIHGPETSKVDGARWTAGDCENGNVNCDYRLRAPSANLEYAAEGQDYTIHVPAGMTGRLAIEIYDPGYVFTGLHCTSNMNSGPPSHPRLQYGDSPYCSGDAGTNRDDPMSTTYTLKTSPTATFNPDAPVAGCPVRTFDGFDDNVNAEISSNPTGDVALGFHRWYRLCVVDLSVAGTDDLVLNVFQGTQGRGENQFSLRAAVLDGSGVRNVAASNQLSISSSSMIEMVSTNYKQNVVFFLARVSPRYAGDVMRTELYSVGDDNPADVKILPPVEATVNGVPLTSFDNCRRIRPGESNERTMTNCVYPRAFAQNRAGEPGFDGRVGTVLTPIPDGYTCNESSPEGCWLRIQMTYTQVTDIQDTTSWSIRPDSQLLRLTQ